MNEHSRNVAGPSIGGGGGRRKAWLLLTAVVFAGCGSKTGLLVCGVETADYFPSAAGPRPIAPWSTTFVSTQRPSFRWVLPPGATGAEVTLCRDAACANPALVVEVDGTSTRAPRALDAGAWFWRLRDRVHGRPGCRVGPIWEFFVRTRDTAIDTSDGVTMDVDRDGFDDLAWGGVDGMVFELFRGSPAGLALPPVISNGLEAVPVSIGDIDGDGTGDFFSRSPLVMLGTPGGTPRERGFSFQWVHATAGGDIDGDGYADLLGVDVSLAPVCLRGGPNPLSTTLPITDSSGLALRPPVGDIIGAFDLNGDGLGDAAMDNGGIIALFLGQTTRLQLAAAFSQEGEVSPHIVHAGDLNGDGYADLFFWQYTDSNSPSLLFVIYGGADPRTYRPSTWEPVEGTLGFVSAVPGDFDNDGFTDLVLVFAMGDAAPRITVHRGGSAGLATGVVLDTRLSGGTVRDMTAGDIDGDGLWDLIEADIRSDNNRLGELRVYTGGLMMRTTQVSSWPWRATRQYVLLAR